MAFNYKMNRTGDESVDRNLQAIQKAFADGTVQAPAETRVTVTKDYRCLGTELMLFVDASRGPVVITLAETSDVPLIVRRSGASANLITIKTNGKTKINNEFPFIAPALGSIMLANDGKLWYTLFTGV